MATVSPLRSRKDRIRAAVLAKLDAHADLVNQGKGYVHITARIKGEDVEVDLDVRA